ncbi:MAG TPA: hypothetical protein VFV94_01995 [Polyangiaceae bacterium]|nr:hypothetical protein [Polyangiaceae bacterium]
MDAGPPKLKPADAGPCPQPYCPETVYDRITDEEANRPRRGIEVDGPTLYWGEYSPSAGGVVRSAPKDGSGPIRTLGQRFDFAYSRSLVVDETHVYWLNVDDTRTWPVLVRVDKDGSNPQTTPIPRFGDNVKLLDLGAIAGTPDAILLATLSCSWILRVPKDGSAIQSWAVSPYPDSGGVTELERFGDFIYCSNGAHIHRLDPATGAVSEIVSGQDHAGPMALIEGSLYFANNDGGTNGDENLALVAPNGGDVQDLGLSFGAAAHLNYDELRHSLYWVTGLSPFIGRVVAYGVGGTAAPTVLLDAQNIMGDSTADADNLYWQSDNAITRLHKWP